MEGLESRRRGSVHSVGTNQLMGDRKVNPRGGEPIYGLVCSGGGVKGAYQVGVLWYIHEHFRRGEASPFRVFTGLSCGSINTTFLAIDPSHALTRIERLRKLWLDFHVPQYFDSFRRQVLRALWRRLRNRGARSARYWSILEFLEDRFPARSDSINASLLFHRDLIRRLIAVGYDDARKRRSDLEEFFAERRHAEECPTAPRGA